MDRLKGYTMEELKALYPEQDWNKGWKRAGLFVIDPDTDELIRYLEEDIDTGKKKWVECQP